MFLLLITEEFFISLYIIIIIIILVVRRPMPKACPHNAPVASVGISNNYDKLLLVEYLPFIPLMRHLLGLQIRRDTSFSFT